MRITMTAFPRYASWIIPTVLGLGLLSGCSQESSKTAPMPEGSVPLPVPASTSAPAASATNPGSGSMPDSTLTSQPQ